MSNLNLKYQNCYVKSDNDKILVFSNKTLNIDELYEFFFNKFKIKKNFIKFIKIKKIPYTFNNKIDYNKLNVD